MRSNSTKPIQFTESKVRSILSRFGVNLSSEQALKTIEYTRLLLKWNQSLNLTSIDEPGEILTRHFGESMFASHAVPVEKGRLADVGSGAGFPGLSLKIVCPELIVTLIEPNKKKCAFLWEVIRTLDFLHVDVISDRFEEARIPAHSFEYVTARAVGGLGHMLRWSRNVLTPEGHVIFWLGGTDATKIGRTHGWIWGTPIKIPDSQRRFLLVGRQNTKA